MKLFGFEISRAEQKSGVTNSLELFRALNGFGGGDISSGVDVSHATALRVTTVLACARVIAEGIAQVPFRLHKRLDGGGSEHAHGERLYEVLELKPNSWMTSFELRETIALHACLTGGALCYIVRGLRNEVAELIPFPRNSWTVKQNADYSLSYEVAYPDGTTETLPASSVWHIRGPSWDTVLGMDIIKQAREAIGLSIATERSQGGMHKNGLRTSGVFSVEKELTEPQHARLMAYLMNAQAGSENAGKPVVVDRNAKFTPATMTGVDAQHLETRKHQIEEVCRVLRVMPIMIGHADKTATYASAEQMFLAHVVHTLSPWYKRIEQSADTQLLTPAQRKAGLFTRFNASALMRGSHTERSNYFSKALGAGNSPAWMTPDEVRMLDDMSPLGGNAANLPTPNTTMPQAAGVE
jgi:HK97 family phage portal protein